MDRKLALAAPLFMLACCGLAVAAPEKRTAPQSKSSNSKTFQDSTGENPNAPDVSTVTVSNDNTPQVTFHIAVPNRPAFTGDMRGYLYVDTDTDVRTGNTDWYGAEESVRFYLNKGTFLARLYEWYGDEWISLPPNAPFSYSYDTSGLTLSIGDSDLGNGRVLRFVFHLWSGVTVDPATGDLDFSKGYADSAPDDSVWLYQVVSPDRLAPHAQALGASGVHALPMRLRYRLWDDSGKARAHLAILRQGVQIWERQVALHVVRKAHVESVYWTVPAAVTGKLRFCVRASDAAGNRSPQNCANVTVR
jgi:hypothetical protein